MIQTHNLACKTAWLCLEDTDDNSPAFQFQRWVLVPSVSSGSPAGTAETCSPRAAIIHRLDPVVARLFNSAVSELGDRVATSPGGRLLRTLGGHSSRSVVPSGRVSIGVLPGVETPGYCRMSLRDSRGGADRHSLRATLALDWKIPKCPDSSLGIKSHGCRSRATTRRFCRMRGSAFVKSLSLRTLELKHPPC